MTHSTPNPIDTAALLQHTDWARRLARYLVRNAADADDIAQEALVIGMRRSAEGVEKRDPRAWLGGVVRRLALQRSRADARRMKRETVAARARKAEARALSQSQLLGDVEVQRVLAEHVMALNERYRDVLLRRYFRGETPSEIAAVEGRSVASISNLLTRAHAALRKRLEADGGEGAWMTALSPLAVVRTKGSAGGMGKLVSMGGGTMFVSIGLKVAAAAVAATIAWLGVSSLKGAPLSTGDSPMTAYDEEEQAQAVPGDSRPEAVDLAAAHESLGAIEANLARRNASTSGPKDAGMEGTSLRVRLVDGRGQGIAGAQLILTASQRDVAVSSTRSNGEALFENLEPDQGLSAYVDFGEGRWPVPVGEVTLVQGEERIVEWCVNPKTVVTGQLVNEIGETLAGQVITFAECPGVWTRKLPGKKEILKTILGGPREETDEVGTTVTDGEGRFLFPAVTPGPYIVVPVKKTRDAFAYSMEPSGIVMATALPDQVESAWEVARAYQVIDVPYNVPVMDVTVEHYTEGQVRGRVVSSLDGEPVLGKVEVVLQATHSGGASAVTTDAEGSFVTGPLMDGEYWLQVFRGPDGWTRGTRVTVQAGASEVTVPVRPAAGVEVRIAFGPGVEASPGRLLVAGLSEHMDFGDRHHAQVPGDRPAVVFPSLRPGAHGFVFFASDGSSAAAHPSTELGVGVLPGGIVLDANAPGTIEVQNQSPDTVVRATYRIHGVQYEVEAIKPGGSEQVLAPAGVNVVTLKGDGRKDRAQRSVQVDPGAKQVLIWN